MMPTYEFRCTQCGITAEIKRAYEDRDSPVNCLYCLVPLTRTWITPPGIAFKGPGWESNHKIQDEQEAIRLKGDAEWDAQHKIGFGRDIEKALNKPKPKDAPQLPPEIMRRAIKKAERGQLVGTC